MRSWLLCLFALTVVVSRSTQQNYPRNDNININAILQNDRILLGYYKCVMDKGPCTKDGKIFKRALPEALPTACGRCTLKQKVAFRTLLLAIRAKSETRFLELLDKYNLSRANKEGLYSFLATGV
uniref:Chemosensory protein 14-like protein n=1 Tax=Antheraea pernyi TaxID=7119 RepID=A0AAU6R5E1_ANTPE